MEKDEYFIQYSIGGIPFIENVDYVKEISYHDKSCFAGETYNLRGLEVPIINCYKRLDLKDKDTEYQNMMIICPDSKKDRDIYVVMIDGVYGFIYSKIGYNVPVKDSHVFADYTRECWDAVGGDQLVFVDWEKFISK